AKAPFGDSTLKETTRDAILAELARIGMDQALLSARFGAERVQAAIAAGGDLAQFADFNANNGGLTHSRDAYMAANLVQAASRLGSGTKAVLWAHNAHVVGGRPPSNKTGAMLRDAFGCGYRAA